MRASERHASLPLGMVSPPKSERETDIKVKGTRPFHSDRNKLSCSKRCFIVRKCIANVVNAGSNRRYPRRRRRGRSRPASAPSDPAMFRVTTGYSLAYAERSSRRERGRT
ncbi:hypothetical protein EVAR_62309_1 [Eumeta japonica]|uniref:Uncharacterized protein n=1 Tax=Eumeta variegata TaxID=151549 RepID=A0A4C1ZHQ6_EUMVA|nr:hypothetical protein EVAR_62309_1 [Eumeta japonica]